MSDQSMVLLIAVVGGIGGALLAGVFQAITTAWSHRRQERHDLDAWLREQRFVHFSRLLELVFEAPTKILPTEREALANQILDTSIPLRTVLPGTLDSLVVESVNLIRDELRAESSERSAKAMAWQGGYLQARFRGALGWDHEALAKKGVQFRVRQRFARHHRGQAR